jgi:shikimate kinase
MLILVSGIPGAGKTTIGDHLRDRHGFRHLDMESSLGRTRRFHGLRKRALLRTATRLRRPVVVTWGFDPGDDELAVKRLLDAGGRLVWLDGDRDAAARHWRRAKPDLDPALFDAQLERIDAHSLNRFGDRAHRIDAFDDSGAHRSKETIADAVMAVGLAA